MKLTLETNFFDTNSRYSQKYSAGDDFYQMLIDSHRDLTEEESTMLNCKLIFLLANHIGDVNVLQEAIKIAQAKR